MSRAYYGDELSKNMVETPEGYLICKNVPIARTGIMEYLGNELPDDFKEPITSRCSVKRDPSEVFSKDTIASFEGKPVTNTHPADNLNVNTVQFVECGHAQNVHPDGNYLMADLFIKDSGLINEIKENVKREVSCGYDCAWVKIGDHKYEQRDIVGNHIAIVKAGRAGHKVAIKDAKPKENYGGMEMSKIRDMILGKGFKEFVKDAEPEEIAKAAKAMHDEDEPEKKEEAKDETVEEQGKEDKKYADLAAEVKQLKEMITKLAAPHEEKKAADAQAIMEALEKEVKEDKKPAKDDDDDDDNDDDDKEEGAQDSAKDDDDDDDDDEDDDEPEEKKAADKKKAHDAYRKIVNDFKPFIMSIPDEKIRTKMAKKFAKTVRDSKTENKNIYAQIMDNAVKAKKKAADSKTVLNARERSVAAVEALAKAGESMQSKKY